MRGSHVYFVCPVGMDGPIKIGVSIDLEVRLKGLNAQSPIPLELIVAIPGGVELERRFHARFVHLHSHYEWFRVAPELAEAISALIAGTFDVETLPSPVIITAKPVVNAESSLASVYKFRLNHLKKHGVEIPKHILIAADTMGCSPEEKTHRRAIVREFVDAQYRILLHGAPLPGEAA